MNKIILIGAVLLGIAGCIEPEWNDGYQFGDISKITWRDIDRLITAREKACGFIGDSVIRQELDKIAVLAIRAYVPAYPEEGVCTDDFDAVIAILRNRARQDG